MQSGYTGYVVRSEWRWVIFVSLVLMVIAFLPFLWVALRASNQAEWQFMGALHQHQDAAAYLSRIQQGSSGNLLVSFKHTPEPNQRLIMQIVYPLLGQFTRITVQALSPIVIFHVARVAASLFMFVALYQLGASIWTRVRTRRVFFLLASIGSGFGWLVATLSGQINALPDLTTAHLYPYFSSLVNVHEPLAIACCALLASIMITHLRPGADNEPRLNNSGIIGVVLSVIVAFVYPEALLPMFLAFIISLFVRWYRRRQIDGRSGRWLLWLFLPSVPVLAYTLLIIRINPFMQEWYRQQATSPPSIVMLVIGLGLPFLIALPGIWRGIRRFEADGDRFMLLWLVAMLGLVYLSASGGLVFALGLMLPLAYFATRAIEDFWIEYVRGRQRFRLFATLLPIIALSHIYITFLPVLPLILEDAGRDGGMVLEPEYRTAFDWLARETQAHEVILAAPEVGTWLPLWTGAKTVYGHLTETMNESAKHTQIMAWYRGQVGDCESLLDGQTFFQNRYDVDYVLYGPREQQVGTAPCLADLHYVATFGAVDIYVTALSDVNADLP